MFASRSHRTRAKSGQCSLAMPTEMPSSSQKPRAARLCKRSTAAIAMNRHRAPNSYLLAEGEDAGAVMARFYLGIARDRRASAGVLRKEQSGRVGLRRSRWARCQRVPRGRSCVFGEMEEESRRNQNARLNGKSLLRLGMAAEFVLLFFFFAAASLLLLLELLKDGDGGGTEIVLYPCGDQPNGISVGGLLEIGVSGLVLVGAHGDHGLYGLKFII